MADETTASDDTPRPGVRAGGTLDLSTGKPAPPPPPEPAPLPPAPADSDVRVGKALDLSKGTGPKGSSRRKPAAASLGGGPVVRETLDLSTKEPAPAASAEPAASASPKRGGPKGGSKKGRSSRGGPKKDQSRGKAPAASSESLADLLDPDVLAQLRGG